MPEDNLNIQGEWCRTCFTSVCRMSRRIGWDSVLRLLQFCIQTQRQCHRGDADRRAGKSAGVPEAENIEEAIATAWSYGWFLPLIKCATEVWSPTCFASPKRVCF